MPCRISTDVHERINDFSTVPTVYRVNPLSSEQSGVNQREEKTPWTEEWRASKFKNPNQNELIGPVLEGKERMTPFKLSEKLAYETGVHIGDGNLYSKGRTHKITYSGNLRNEEDYYLTVLKPILERLYNVCPAVIRNKRRNVILLVVNSKRVAEFKTKILKMPNGPKTSINIPESIKQQPKLLKECIKGIGDTDFSVSFKKDRRGIYHEPRIELFSRSKELVEELWQTLSSMTFTVTKELMKRRRGFIENRLRIYGKKI